MVHMKTVVVAVVVSVIVSVVVSVVAVLSVFLHPRSRAQPTISSSTEAVTTSIGNRPTTFDFGKRSRLPDVTTSSPIGNTTIFFGKRSRLPALTTSSIGNTTFGFGKRSRLPVTATFIGNFDPRGSHFGFTKVEDKIYVLISNPYKIKVYEDLIGFHFKRDIALSGTTCPQDIVYSNNSKCVYMHDGCQGCIWVMTTTGEHRLTKWLTIVTNKVGPNALSLSNEGHLLVLKRSQSLSESSQNSLEIYSLNARLIRRLYLAPDFQGTQHVVQTSVGNFIILHHLNNAWTGDWVISQLTNDGQLINRFIPGNQSVEFHEAVHLSLDSKNNRLFVADGERHRVILFDSSDLTWSQVIVSREINGISYPFRLLYDASNKRLFVSQRANVIVYEIN